MRLRWQLQQIAQTLRQRLVFYTALYHDPRTPWSARLFLWLALAYVAMPFDLIPDFIPLLGQLDDALIVPVLLLLAMRWVPADVYAEHYQRLYPPPPTALGGENEQCTPGGGSASD